MASTSSKHSQKQDVGSKSTDMEEIVRYMSNLPSYLERGKPVQDRALNFGVLDWGRLEQWQYHHHKPSVIPGNKHSPSGSNSSNRSSLYSHLNISTEEICTKDAPVSRSSEKKTTNQSRTKPRGLKKNDLHPQDRVESKSSDDMESFQTASSSSSSKGKMKVQDAAPKTDPPNLCPFENVTVSTKNLKNKGGSKTKPSATRQIKTPEEKEFSVSSKNPDSKTGRKNRFSFNTSSKLAVTQNPPEDSKIKTKAKMDLGSCKDIRVDNSCMNKTNDSSSSRKRAHFQMAVKNGSPLFTFSVDDNNNNDILAATVRSLKDDTNSWVYTFFAIQEVKKKKSGWLYHTTKDRSNTYLPNVTAQMTVSNPAVCDSTAREFVLASVDSGQPENELAAIVVRFLTKAGEDENQDCFRATVVLPGGHHSVPRKGEPSPLIERWRSGGRCDCGGWDVGCRLRTLTNNVQCSRRSNAPESFDLFLQGDVINERPFFSLTSIKDAIFSVEYDASLPILHAFSICISVIECRKSSHQTELRTYVAKRVDDDVAPVTYASLPPVSPVGRV